MAKVYDQLDLMHGVQAFLNAYQGASVASLIKGFNDAGVPNNNTTALIWSELMDAKSLFLTANADTVYFWMNFDLSQGPLVVETPPNSLGMIDDIWFNYVTDIGLPGPDRGAGGKYLLVPPDYKGDLPEGGYFVNKVRATRLTMLGRAFMVKTTPSPRSLRSSSHSRSILTSRAATVLASPLHWQATPLWRARLSTRWTGPFSNPKRQ